MDAPYNIVHPKDSDIERVVKEQSINKILEDGKRYLYTINGPMSTTIILSYIEWDSGAKEVRAEQTESQSSKILRLEHGLRLGFGKEVEYLKKQYAYIPLRQARIKNKTSKDWSNLFNAGLDQIKQGAGFDAITHLEEYGALKIIQGKHIFPTSVSNKNMYYLLYEKGNREVPIRAFVVTRILPLLNNYLSDIQYDLF